MDFDLTQEQRMIRESVRKFLEKECPKEYVREIDEKEEFPQQIWEKMAEMGLMGLPIPGEYGGTGGSTLDTVLVMEELARGILVASLAYMMCACFGANTVGLYGNEEQKRFYLPKLARGEIKFAIGLTETSGGTDILSLSTSAKKEGDGYIINGHKIFTTGAHIADYVTLAARTEKNVRKRSEGITLFIVDLKSPGITIRPLKKLGWKAMGSNEVLFTDVKVPEENILGELHKGWYSLVATLDNERILVAAGALGLAQAAFEDALNYAKERYAFGKPIGQFQSIQHYLANMATEIELARLLTYKAAWLESRGIKSDMEASMAKLATSETLTRVTQMGMQILGGYGFMMEYDMQRYFRDARVFTIGPISNEMIRNYIGEKLGLPRSY